MSKHTCKYHDDGGECIVCGQTVADQLLEKFDGGAVHRLVARERRPYGFPVSRDWEDVDCKAVGCRFNRNEKCMTPSICKISDDGRCTGFQMDPMKVGKPDGD